MDFPTTVACAMSLSKTLGGGVPTKLVIEEVGYQKSIIDHLRNLNFPAEGLGLMDKTSASERRL